MTAILPEQQLRLPRKNQYSPNGGFKLDPNGNGFINQSRSARYQHLPDYDQNESDEDIERKLNERFEIMRLMTQDAIAGKVRAMIASGPGGVGKTFTIDEELEKWDPDGENYTSSRGYMRATGLYKMLWKHRAHGDLVKLDDMDSVFYDDTSLNFIKIACDTTQRRVITYAAETFLTDEETGDPIPRNFEYNGTMMFITNLDFDQMIDKNNKLTPHLEALVTRSHYIDLMMKTKRDYLIRVFQVARQGLFDQIEGGLTQEEENDVLEFIDQHYRNLRECSLRMALKIGNLRKGADPDAAISWQRKTMLTCCRGVI
jgi:hypothetical protein